MTTFKKAILAAVVATAFSAGSALAAGNGIDFKVDEGVVPGSSPNVFTADAFNFDYSAVINQSLVGGALDGDDPFTEVGTMSVSAWVLNGTSLSTQLNNFGAAGYKIVADFTAAGMATQEGAGIKAIFSSFDLNLWLDSDSDGVGDTKLGTASLSAYSEAHIFGGLANGDYDVFTMFTPTAFGSTFFIDPVPFKLTMEFTGVTTEIDGATLPPPFTADVNGSGNAFVFPIPEPSSVLLLGIGLLGLGRSLRRKVTG